MAKANKWARALQQDTGWSYSECLRCTRTMTQDEIDKLIETRKLQHEADADPKAKG